MVRENRCRGGHRAPVLSIPGQPVKPTRRARRPGAPSPVPRNAPPAGADVPIGPPSPNTVIVDRTGGHRPPLQPIYHHQVKSRQRLRCVRPYKRYTNRHGGICGTGPTQHPTSPGGKSKRGRQSGSGRPQQIQRRGHALKTPSAKQKPPPPRPKHRAKPTRRSTEGAPRPMVLRGERIRAVPPCGGLKPA